MARGQSIYSHAPVTVRTLILIELGHALPPDFEVVGGDGEPVRPSPGRQFFVTVETFNPFHGLSEAEPWP